MERGCGQGHDLYIKPSDAVDRRKWSIMRDYRDNWSDRQQQ